jgi:hypothetical protein
LNGREWSGHEHLPRDGILIYVRADIQTPHLPLIFNTKLPQDLGKMIGSSNIISGIRLPYTRIDGYLKNNVMIEREGRTPLLLAHRGECSTSLAHDLPYYPD